MKVAFLIPSGNEETLQKTLTYVDKLEPQPDITIINRERLGNAKDRIEAIGHARQQLLESIRKKDVDYAIYLDDDIYIPQRDFITRITAWQKDLVGAPYPIFRVERGVCLVPLWINTGADRVEYPCVVKTVCDGFTEANAVGGGAMCISRKLLRDTRVNFMPIIRWPQRYSEDVGYCLRARLCGYRVYVDGSLLLGHRVKLKDLKPGEAVTLMPEDYYRVLNEVNRVMMMR